MFTGIIETTATVFAIQKEGSNKKITFNSTLATELKIDQSVAHNGVCLTVVEIIDHELYAVVAIQETLQRTNLDTWVVGDKINIERCMPANGRFDGHIVQGHVDTTATCMNVVDKNGSWEFTFELRNENDSLLIVPKGSICINGISLTVAMVNAKIFSVAIIPYTYEHTNMHQINASSIVNIEFDIIGKYIAKMMANR